ncbi:MAG: hypothetical protein V3V97_18470 [Hyphomicrobiaceae bacterium]
MDDRIKEDVNSSPLLTVLHFCAATAGLSTPFSWCIIDPPFSQVTFEYRCEQSEALPK